MIIFVFILLLIMFADIKAKGKNEYFDDYCGPKQTSTINGIFTILIFFSHASQYVNLGGALDEPYLAMRKYIGQLVVVTFLFFSGYGIMESISKKGNAYVKSIPSKRFFRVWYHFAIALVLYIIVNLVFSREYGIKNTILSFTGWTSVGNSNWYMLVTFALYIIVFVSFMISRKSRVLGVALVFALTLAFSVFEYKMGLKDRYYNTIFCFPAGMLFSLIKPYFNKFVMKNDIIWSCSFAAGFAVYYYFSSNRDDSIIHHTLFSILAVILIMLFTMKVKIGNSILDWFSKHIFSVFILQRLPMIALEHFGFTDHKYAFIIVSLIATVALATIFDEAMEFLDNLIFRKTKQKTDLIKTGK